MAYQPFSVVLQFCPLLKICGETSILLTVFIGLLSFNNEEDYGTGNNKIYMSLQHLLTIQQQILEICVCCYYSDNDYIPTEILQLLVKKIIVLAHKIQNYNDKNDSILNEEHSVKRKREKVDE